MPLKDRLKQARTARNLHSQQALATLVGCRQSVIGALESGANTSSKWIPLIAQALRVPAVWLTDEKFDGPDPLREEAEGANVVDLAARRDPVVAAALEIMEGLDARGRLECFAAVRATADRYLGSRPAKTSGE